MQQEVLLKAWKLMCVSAAMAETYEANRAICKYVHAGSRGHEAIQLAVGMQLLPIDYVSPYYRDESMLLGMGYTPYELMLQLLAKRDDPFSAGRSYYAHPNNRLADKPQMIHQSSATGMQVIPATGIAQGLQYLAAIGSPLLRKGPHGDLPVVVCSLGDGSVTEGEVSEAFQFAILKKLPIIYLVQDNQWGISASAAESRMMDAWEYAAGFPGLKRIRVNGSDFVDCYGQLQQIITEVRQDRCPCLLHAAVPLLTHHTSGVRREFYRTKEDWDKHTLADPIPKLRLHLTGIGVQEAVLQQLEAEAKQMVANDFEKACAAAEPDPQSVAVHVFAEGGPVTEQGERTPAGAEKTFMVDAALFAIREIMEDHPEAILYGQDVGKRLGGVFREAATLAQRFGEHRVFNTAIQEAYIIGSVTGMCATGVRPIVEVQFGDYIYPAFNQLVTEIAKSCYLSNGKFPIPAVIRVPVGAYGGGGPYHSSSVETTLLSIKGIKIAYPSNAADMKGLMKAAFYDPNPVIMMEHKGLYWSKVPGTEEAKTTEPDRNYIVPLGKGRLVITADERHIVAGASCCIICYGMGVYWAMQAATAFPGQVSIVDLRSLFPLDEALIFETVRRHGRCLVLTEEQQNNSFAEALAGRISSHCFQQLDAPVAVLGALNVPALPINTLLEGAMLPGPDKIKSILEALLSF
jgi:2-oxoisovalerate dehydrogenase E1 component